MPGPLSAGTATSAPPASAAAAGTPAKTHCVYFRTAREGPPAGKGPGPAVRGRVPPFTPPEVSDTDYGIAHIAAKPSLGLAMSGGGFRAATCAAGWARGLHNIKIDKPGNGKAATALSAARYLATTSGGSWFNAALSYKAPSADSQTDIDTFLGPIAHPSELTPEAIAQDPPHGSFTSAVAVHNMLDTFLDAMADEWVPLAKRAEELQNAVKAKVAAILNMEAAKEEALPEWVHPWTHAVAQTFLKPYGLNIYADSTLTAAGTRGDIAAGRAAANAAHVITACTDPDRPFPIMMGSAFNPPGDDGYTMYNYEFTPLYFGTPAPFPYSKPPLGGGYVEPWGLHAVPTTPCLNGGADKGSDDPSGCGCVSGTVVVDRSGLDPVNKLPMHTVPLAEAVSISSSFLAAAANTRSDMAQRLASTEELVNWSVLPLDEKAPPPCAPIKFADGGATDNLGVSALLRRGVKAMIVMSAASAPPDDTWERYAEEACDVACWFGAARGSWTPGITATELNDQCLVFAPSVMEGERLWRELFEDVHRKLRAGRPGFHRGTYRVYENEFHHIPARTGEGEEVHVLWIFNHQWADWERSLPADTYAKLVADRKGKDGKDKGIHNTSVMERKPMEGELSEGAAGFLKQHNLYRFPYFTTFSLDFSNEATHMLSQLSTAVICDPEVQEEIKALVKIASEAA